MRVSSRPSAVSAAASAWRSSYLGRSAHVSDPALNRNEEAVVLNTKFCSKCSDFTLHWTDKDSMREVRSLTSEYNILSPGVLGLLEEPFSNFGTCGGFVGLRVSHIRTR